MSERRLAYPYSADIAVETAYGCDSEIATDSVVMVACVTAALSESVACEPVVELQQHSASVGNNGQLDTHPVEDETPPSFSVVDDSLSEYTSINTSIEQLLVTDVGNTANSAAPAGPVCVPPAPSTPGSVDLDGESYGTWARNFDSFSDNDMSFEDLIEHGRNKSGRVLDVSNVNGEQLSGSSSTGGVGRVGSEQQEIYYEGERGEEWEGYVFLESDFEPSEERLNGI